MADLPYDIAGLQIQILCRAPDDDGTERRTIHREVWIPIAQNARIASVQTNDAKLLPVIMARLMEAYLFRNGPKQPGFDLDVEKPELLAAIDRALHSRCGHIVP